MELVVLNCVFRRLIKYYSGMLDCNAVCQFACFRLVVSNGNGTFADL